MMDLTTMTRNAHHPPAVQLIMKRDEFRSEGGDLHQNLEELEADPHIFDTGVHGISNDTRPLSPPTPATAHPHRPSIEVQFVDASDDPNLHITRRIGELEPLPHEGNPATQDKPNFHVESQPMRPLRDQGPILHPRSRPRKGAL